MNRTRIGRAAGVAYCATNFMLAWIGPSSLDSRSNEHHFVLQGCQTTNVIDIIDYSGEGSKTAGLLHADKPVANKSARSRHQVCGCFLKMPAPPRTVHLCGVSRRSLQESLHSKSAFYFLVHRSTIPNGPRAPSYSMSLENKQGDAFAITFAFLAGATFSVALRVISRLKLRQSIGVSLW